MNTNRTERLYAIGLCSALFVIFMNILISGAFNAMNKYLAISNNYQFVSSINDPFMGSYAWSIVPSLLLSCLLIFNIFQYFTFNRKLVLGYIIVITAGLVAVNYQSVDNYMFDHIKEFYSSIASNADFVQSDYFKPMTQAIHTHDYTALKDLTNNPEVLKFKK